MKGAVCLKVRGFHIPAFKNTKMMARGRLITDPRKQKIMGRIIRSLQFQLRSVLPIEDTAISMGPWPLCSILLSAHSTDFDDSRQWIPKITIESVEVAKGEEGADIEITLYEKNSTTDRLGSGRPTRERR